MVNIVKMAWKKCQISDEFYEILQKFERFKINIVKMTWKKCQISAEFH
jgi:hypothetical protein